MLRTSFGIFTGKQVHGRAYVSDISRVSLALPLCGETTLDPKPQTLNPKPQAGITNNPKPDTPESPPQVRLWLRLVLACFLTGLALWGRECETVERERKREIEGWRARSVGWETERRKRERERHGQSD